MKVDDSNQNLENLGRQCNVSVSIIICTYNRCGSLRQTLEALDRVRIPPKWEAELVLVDNASTDCTGTVARNTRLSNMEVRYVYEEKKGKGNAYNAGLRNARGEFILFTDDDALPDDDWVEQLVNPLQKGECDAVTGRVILAGHLMRPWLSRAQRWWLGSSDDAEPRSGVRELIGCNMGFRRAVLDRVPGFDPELGPGALGFGDDSLFGWQLSEAGFKIEYVPEACVVHQFDKSRLQRVHWLSAAGKRGQTQAYLRYHWWHADIRFPELKWVLYFAKLHLRRVFQRPATPESEGCALWEMSYVGNLEMNRQFRVERRRRRNYSARGLVKNKI